ncbi:hypothetical protein GCM10028784_25780 [Myceligenerans cantabricum]
MSIPMATQVAPVRPALGLSVAAVAGLAAAVLMLRLLPLRTVLTLAALVKSLAPRRATRAEAANAIAARNWAASHYPGRATCLDLSLAALLTTAFRALCVDWCIGCRFNPSESHAWIEADDGPVGEDNLFDDPFIVTVRI